MKSDLVIINKMKLYHNFKEPVMRKEQFDFVKRMKVKETIYLFFFLIKKMHFCINKKKLKKIFLLKIWV